jgi:hypothetical protein
MATPVTAATLIPSEQVLLNAATLVPKGGLLDKYKVLGTEVEVSKKQLARLVYAAAFLALEQAGDIRLEVRPKKALLGLRTVQALYAQPVDGPHAWPQVSLEAHLLSLAEQLQAKKGQNEVNNIIYAFLGKDVVDPYDLAIQMVYERLADRSVVTVVEEKKLKIFTVRRFALPEATAAVALGYAETARQFIAAGEVGKGELWKMLLAQIDKGISNRTEEHETSISN